MPTLKIADEDVKLFGASDVYFHTVDNRPLRELITNDRATATELDDVRLKFRECATWNIESPVQENLAGGFYVPQWGGIPARVVLSCGQPGTSGQFEIDIKVGPGSFTSIFASPAERPVLAFDAANSVIISLPPNILDDEVAPDSHIRLDIIQAQVDARWMRVDLFLATELVASSASDFD